MLGETHLAVTFVSYRLVGMTKRQNPFMDPQWEQQHREQLVVSAEEERESKSRIGSALRVEEASRTREGLGKGLSASACGVTGPGWQMVASRLLDSSALCLLSPQTLSLSHVLERM